MHPRPGNTLGPRPEHGVGVSFPGVPPGPSGVQRRSPGTSGASGQHVSAGSAGPRPSPEGVQRDHRPFTPRAARWVSPVPPLASVSSGIPAPEVRSPHGVGPGRYPGKTRRSQDPTGIGRRRRVRGASSSPASAGPRGPAPAPTPAAPELRLMRFSQPGGSFSSSAIFPPAAAPAPPPPHRLCGPRPPTAAADWLGTPGPGAWRRCSLGTLTALRGFQAFYWVTAKLGGSSQHFRRVPPPYGLTRIPPPSSLGP